MAACLYQQADGPTPDSPNTVPKMNRFNNYASSSLYETVYSLRNRNTVDVCICDITDVGS